MSTFRLVGLEAAAFEPFFAMDAPALAAIGARRLRADSMPGYPCRISLEDAGAGEQLLLLPFEHLPARSPYRASGPVYVRARAQRAVLEPGVVPPYVTRRLMSVRAYDASDMMLAGEVCEGAEVHATLERLVKDAAVSFIHLHNAKRGCFSCLVERVG